MISDNDDVYRPSLQAIEKPADYGFFAITLNEVFGEDLLWTPERFDWVKSDNSATVLGGGSAATAVVSGENSSVYVEGLEKTVLANSSALDLRAENGNFTLVYDSDITQDVVISASGSNAQILNLSSNAFDVNNFEIVGEALRYQLYDGIITFDLTDGSEVNLHSVSSSHALTVSHSKGQYQVSNEAYTVNFHNDLLSEVDTSTTTNSVLLGDFSDTDVSTISNSDEALKILTNIRENEDIEIQNILDSYYADVGHDHVLSPEQNLSAISSVKLQENINEVLSSVDDDLVFSVTDGNISVPQISQEKASKLNEATVDDLLTSNSYEDLIFDSALEFYNEI